MEIQYIFVTVLSSLLLVVTTPLVLIKLKGRRELAEKIVFGICCFILIYKCIHFAMYCTIYNKKINDQLPLEVSAISYFLFPISYLTGCKWTKDVSRFVAFMAGFIEIVATIVSPKSFITSGMSYFTFIESIFMHYSLFLGSLICITRIEVLPVKKVHIASAGFFALVIWGGVIGGMTWKPYPGSNIMFLHENVLPDFLLIPGFDQHHLYIIEYLIAYVIFIAIIYSLSMLSQRKNPKQPCSAWGMGQLEKFREYLEKTQTPALVAQLPEQSEGRS